MSIFLDIFLFSRIWEEKDMNLASFSNFGHFHDIETRKSSTIARFLTISKNLRPVMSDLIIDFCLFSRV